MKEQLLVAIDLETRCAVGCSKVCQHALDPVTSVITCIGMYSVSNLGNVHKKVFRDLDEFRKVIVDNPHFVFVGQNFKWDLHQLYHVGIELPLNAWVFDTQLMAHGSTEKIHPQWMLDYEKKRQEANKKCKKGFSHRQAGQHSLKTLAPFFLGVEPFWEDPSNHNDDEYVLKDCEYTYRLCKYFESSMAKDGTLEFFKTKLLPWTKMLFQVERRGVKLDMHELDLLEKKTEKERDEALAQLTAMWHNELQAYKTEKEQKLYALYWKKNEMSARYPIGPDGKMHERYFKAFKRDIGTVGEFNFDSANQVLHMLRDRLKLSVRNLADKDSTGKEVLQRLAEGGREDVALLLKYRHSKKLLSSFFAPYREKQRDSALHCTFKSDGTRTGRLSSASVNLQQVSSDLRTMFVARPGYKFVTRDLSAIEPTLAAYVTEDPRLCDIMISGKDFHSQNAIIMCDLRIDEKDVKSEVPWARKIAKTCGLAILYGAGAKRIQQTAIQAGHPWEFAKCQKICDNFRQAYRVAFDFKRALDFKAAQEPIKNLLGRTHVYPVKQDIYMTAFNTLIQSSASDLLLSGVFAAYNRFKEEQIDACPVLLVHDEVVFEVPEERADYCAKVITDSITGFELKTPYGIIPLKSEGTISHRWEK